MVALFATLWACVLGTTGGGAATPTASFTTATPGGSISVSLLTPTLTLQGLPNQDTELIGPVATATAAAGTAIAQTATAAVPTPTVQGVFVEPAVCPAAGTPTLPSQPPAFTEYAELIVEYLSAGGPSTILEATLRSWGAVTDFGGLVRADRDFTGDGVPEVLINAFDPLNADIDPQPGDVMIFGCESGAYRLLYQAGYSTDRSAPLIATADDINGDFINDLVYTVQTCNQRTCYGDVTAVEWSLRLGNFDTLFEAAIKDIPFPEVVAQDVDEDGLREIVVTSGTIADPEAGPQRTFTTVYKWDGTLFRVAQVNTSPVEFRVHLLHDGDDALFRGDTQTAIELYQQAIDDDLLLSWEYPNEAIYLRVYAHYRIMLALILDNKVPAAQDKHDEIMAMYGQGEPTPEGQEPPPEPESEASPTPFIGPLPGLEFARMADVFWQDFTVNRDVGRACDLVVGYARANPSSYEVLNSFGYANREYLASDMCPFEN